MLFNFETHVPQLGQGVFVAPSASVLGQVELADDVSIWYGSVLRGDVGHIRVGPRTNIQDGCVVHVTSGKFDTTLSHDITVGHRVLLHGCTIEDHVLVGMGAVIMDGVSVGPYCIIGAGSLLPPGKQILPRSLVMGSPARVVREVTDAEMQQIDHSAAHYVQLAKRHHGVKAVS